MSKQITLDRFTVGEDLGSGAFASVKVGTSADDGTQWALKISEIKSSAPSAAIQCMSNEIRAAKILNQYPAHPNIVKYSSYNGLSKMVTR